METNFKITIPKPCHENWNAMTPDATGRFCSSCTKTVVDFTNKSTTEIQQYFIENKDQKVCGHFKNEQVNKFNLHIPQSLLNKRRPFHKAFLLTLFIVMGTSLFSCRNHNDQTLGEVVIKDTLKNQPNELLGDTIAIQKDSINKNEGIIDGMVLPIQNKDSIKSEKK
jgi:hypothetical protein